MSLVCFPYWCLEIFTPSQFLHLLPPPQHLREFAQAGSSVRTQAGRDWLGRPERCAEQEWGEEGGRVAREEQAAIGRWRPRPGSCALGPPPPSCAQQLLPAASSRVLPPLAQSGPVSKMSLPSGLSGGSTTIAATARGGTGCSFGAVLCSPHQALLPRLSSGLSTQLPGHLEAFGCETLVLFDGEECRAS